MWHSVYRELNLGGEDAPEYDKAVGTVDVFKYYFSEIDSVEIDGDTCTLDVHLMGFVKHHDPVTYRPFWHWVDYGPHTIEIDQTGIRFLSGFPPSGTTHRIR